MLKRDSLTAQMQQLSHTLAKVKRLITEGQDMQARESLMEVLGTYFGTTITDLLETPANVFVQHLNREGFQPEELDLLADFMDTAALLEDDHENKSVLLEKVVSIYDLLETVHKVVSFAHIARRAAIEQLLSSKKR